MQKWKGEIDAKWNENKGEAFTQQIMLAMRAEGTSSIKSGQVAFDHPKTKTRHGADLQTKIEEKRRPESAYSS